MQKTFNFLLQEGRDTLLYGITDIRDMIIEWKALDYNYKFYYNYLILLG